MLCTKCGQPLPEGSKFCNNCGQSVSATPPSQSAQPQGQPQPQPQYQPQPQPQAPYVPTTPVEAKAAPASAKKKKRTIILVSIIAAVLILAAVATVLVLHFMSDDSGDDSGSKKDTEVTAKKDKDEAKADDLAGEWHSGVNFGDITDAMGDSLNAELGGMEEYIDFDRLDMPVMLTLKDDGTYCFTLDEGDMDDFMDDYKAVLIDGMSAAVEDQTGMSLEEALEVQGRSMDELDEEFDKQFNSDAIDEMIENSTFEGQYKVEDGKLYMSEGKSAEPDEDEYVPYELDGDTLTLKKSSGKAPSDLGEFLPMEFERS